MCGIERVLCGLAQVCLWRILCKLLLFICLCVWYVICSWMCKRKMMNLCKNDLIGLKQLL